jgi:hypothetical protein
LPQTHPTIVAYCAAGVKEEKNHRDQAITWFSSTPSLHNKQELLCLALLFELCGFESVGKEKWLKFALKPLPMNFSVKEFGKVAEYSDWFATGGKSSYAHSYLEHALRVRSFCDAEVEKVAAAMQVFP